MIIFLSPTASSYFKCPGIYISCNCPVSVGQVCSACNSRHVPQNSASAGRASAPAPTITAAGTATSAALWTWGSGRGSSCESVWCSGHRSTAVKPLPGDGTEPDAAWRRHDQRNRADGSVWDVPDGWSRRRLSRANPAAAAVWWLWPTSEGSGTRVCASGAAVGPASRWVRPSGRAPGTVAGTASRRGSGQDGGAAPATVGGSDGWPAVVTVRWNAGCVWRTGATATAAVWRVCVRGARSRPATEPSSKEANQLGRPAESKPTEASQLGKQRPTESRSRTENFEFGGTEVWRSAKHCECGMEQSTN